MNKKHLLAQRLHVVHSLERLLHTLHTLSHLLTPSLWLLLVRTITVSGDPDPKMRSLRFWFGLVAVANLGIIHDLVTGAFWKGEMAGGSGAILDFIGNDPRPSRIYLSLLDITILWLQLLLVYTAYEAQLMTIPHTSSAPRTLSSSDQDQDYLLPTSTSLSQDPDLEASMPQKDGRVIMDVKWRNIWHRLRYPPQIQVSENQGPGDRGRTAGGLSVPHPFAEAAFQILPFAPTPPRIERLSSRVQGETVEERTLPGSLNPS